MEAPGSPPAFETEIFKLGTNPFKACCVFAMGRDSICFEVTVETAPVKLTFSQFHNLQLPPLLNLK